MQQSVLWKPLRGALISGAFCDGERPTSYSSAGELTELKALCRCSSGQEGCAREVTSSVFPWSGFTEHCGQKSRHVTYITYRVLLGAFGWFHCSLRCKEKTLYYRWTLPSFHPFYLDMLLSPVWWWSKKSKLPGLIWQLRQLAHRFGSCFLARLSLNAEFPSWKLLYQYFKSFDVASFCLFHFFACGPGQCSPAELPTILGMLCMCPGPFGTCWAHVTIQDLKCGYCD